MTAWEAWVGLGANIGDPARTISKAVSRLDSHAAVRVVEKSGLYRSEPWGVREQPFFLNAVARIETGLTPEDLLDFLLRIERELGRERKHERWGPRNIDLDLLSYDNRVLQSRRLELPHPRMHRRAFVLVPLLELEPDFVIPGKGSASDCLERIDTEERLGVAPVADEIQDA